MSATAAPVNVDVPHVQQSGNTLNCTMGNWNNMDIDPVSYAYQWISDGATNIGTDAADYTITSGDVGHTVTCVVTATNTVGSTPAPPSVGVVVSESTGSAPVNVDVPYVSQSGDTMNCTMGNWDGEPTTYSYQWISDGAMNIGSDAADYTVTSNDIGKTLTCVVTATNGMGSTTAPPSNGVVVTMPEVGPAPPTQEQIAQVFEGVRAQAKFRDERTNALVACEEMSAALQTLIPILQEPFTEHLPDVTAGVTEAIASVGVLRAAVVAAEPPPPPTAPADPSVPLTQDQVDYTKRAIKAQTVFTDLQANSLAQIDENTVTLQVCLQWCNEADAADHLIEIAAGVNGAIEQVSRMRSSFGSTLS